MAATLLLTPLMLASATTTLDVPASQYTHTEQTQAGLHKTLAQYTPQTLMCMSTFTANGSQTFDYQGRPHDSDNDQDNSGDC